MITVIGRTLATPTGDVARDHLLQGQQLLTGAVRPRIALVHAVQTSPLVRGREITVDGFLPAPVPEKALVLCCTRSRSTGRMELSTPHWTEARAVRKGDYLAALLDEPNKLPYTAQDCGYWFIAGMTLAGSAPPDENSDAMATAMAFGPSMSDTEGLTQKRCEAFLRGEAHALSHEAALSLWQGWVYGGAHAADGSIASHMARVGRKVLRRPVNLVQYGWESWGTCTPERSQNQFIEGHNLWSRVMNNKALSDSTKGTEVLLPARMSLYSDGLLMSSDR